MRGEREYPVPTLAVPDPSRREPVPELIHYEAVRLFAERAQAAKPDFALTDENAAAVVEICRRLDGLPLAIELAAARIKLLPPQALLERLGDRLKVLMGGARDAPARQQTLRDAIAWSHDLLSPHEQTLFRRLGSSPADARWRRWRPSPMLPAIWTSWRMGSLVDESLLRQAEDAGGEPRYTLLETVREFSLDRLTVSGEERLLRSQHAAYFAGLAESLQPDIDGPEQVRTAAALGAEQDNLRAAIAWAIEQLDAETALRLTGNLWGFWLVRSRQTEGRDWLERSLAVPGDALPNTRLEALFAAGIFARQQGDYGRAVLHGEEGLALARASDHSFHAARSLSLLGLVAHSQGDLVRARSLFEEAVVPVRAAGYARAETMILNNLGDTLAAEGDLRAAQACYEEGLAISRQRGRHVGHGHRPPQSWPIGPPCGTYPASRRIAQRRLTDDR